MMNKTLPLTPLEKKVIDALCRNISGAYIVGGFVRDIFLRPKVHRKDIDVVCKNAGKGAKAIAGEFSAPLVELDRGRGIYRVVIEDDFHIDFADMQGTIKNDLFKRDFTVNAIAIDPVELSVIDPLGGIKDIEKKKLRLCSRSAFKDDPLRILRAYSISADCGLKWDRNVAPVLRDDFKLLNLVARERINNELKRLFSSSNSYEWFFRMYKDGIFEELFPEALTMEDMYQGPYHHLDVLMHSFDSLKWGEALLNNLKFISNIRHKDVLMGYLSSNIGNWQRSALLKWVMFWHDIGKPISRRMKGEKIVFYGHNKSGASALKRIMKRLKFSARQISWCAMMVEMHLRPGDLTKAGNLKAFYRFLRQVDGEDLAVMLLSWADARATRGIKNPFVNFTRHRKQLIEFINLSLDLKTRPALPVLIDGHEIMKLTGLAPSKEVGEILNRIKELQLAGKINNKQQAKEFVKMWYNKRRHEA